MAARAAMEQHGRWPAPYFAQYEASPVAGFDRAGIAFLRFSDDWNILGDGRRVADVWPGIIRRLACFGLFVQPTKCAAVFLAADAQGIGPPAEDLRITNIIPRECHGAKVFGAAVVAGCAQTQQAYVADLAAERVDKAERIAEVAVDLALHSEHPMSRQIAWLLVARSVARTLDHDVRLARHAGYTNCLQPCSN